MYQSNTGSIAQQCYLAKQSSTEVPNPWVATKYRAMVLGRKNILGKMSIYATVLFIVCSSTATIKVYIEGAVSENISSSLATGSANVNMSVRQTSHKSSFSRGGKKKPSDGDNTETATDEKKGKN